MNIVFAGTPAFALPCLDALLASHHTICAVYTQPDRPAGRGRTLQASAVKTWALQHQKPVYQPLNFKDQSTFDTLAALNPDLLIVIAYGLILPETVLRLPRYGCINVHASRLPRWRGASPIQHALLMGDHDTAITIMQMDVGMDTGDILTQSPCPIEPHDTSETLHDRLAHTAVTPLMNTLDALEQGALVATKQEAHHVTYAPKINKSDAHIQWSQPAVDIERTIRAFSPWPIAYTQVNDLVVRVHQARVIEQDSNQKPGTIVALDRQGILVSTGHHMLLIERIQLPGSKIISIADWLNAGKTMLSPSLVFQ